MARPRKDQGDCAEQRIKDAFWALLEQNDLKDITVSMITSKANCNRGTFYYHFNSLEELVDAIITDELSSTAAYHVPCFIFSAKI